MMMPKRSALKVLALDTSTARSSVAMLEGREVRAEMRLHTSKTHSTLLLKSIDFLLDRLAWTLGDLNLVAVGMGPGSFTGIRIGVSTALGISQSCSIPFAGVNGLDALAHQVEYVDGHIGVLLDAHRSQVFYAEYIREGGRIRRSKKYCVIHASELESHFADRHLYIVGDLVGCGIQEGAKGASSEWPRALSVDLFLASGIGRLALARRRLWRTGDYIVTEPVYIRPPDAIRNKNRKH
jgi:tRNA threonylcarbamoyladenosine biosynthesis protein TsaB